ncbi:hypothetical protein CWR48_14670 [Oceanobacillus arenosus]|uniref:Uncharacterized protein n=1 Tax=Oceanobacillus arenosus TaxID=1229153 RepID=A0A3D8PNC2_9BACI|nr:YppG family protein [Oceanobacillus arenosus]RDW17162.1 hypothetical protein CWR48_14670 [Oceanobacillus arenosus]
MNYNPSYYQGEPVYPPNNFYNHMYPQQPFQQNYPINSPIMQQQQTPYDYFQKPQQPLNWANQASTNPNFSQSPNGGQSSNIKSYFQDEKGQVDFDKMLSTVGQLASTYHQVSPIIQQFGSIIKNFRT